MNIVPPRPVGVCLRGRLSSNVRPQKQAPAVAASLAAKPRTYHLAMATKHHNWQDRWQVDRAQGTATHETGLRVKLTDGVGVAINPAEIQAVLVPTHGEHNAPAMVARLTREGAQMLIDPYARGWRGAEGKKPA